MYSLVDDLVMVEPGTFVSALHFFLGLLVLPPLRPLSSSSQGGQQRELGGISRSQSSSSSSSPPRESPLLTSSKVSPRSMTQSRTGCSTESASRSSTPISEFINSVLYLDGDLNPNSESELEKDPGPYMESIVEGKLSASNFASRSVLTALNKLISKVKCVQYNDEILKKRGTNRIFLSTQKYDDYRLNSLPLSVISECLLGDSMSRLEALKLLLNLITLHPIHATQIGKNKNIMTFLISSAVSRLMPLPSTSINEEIKETKDTSNINSNIRIKDNSSGTDLHSNHDKNKNKNKMEDTMKNKDDEYDMKKSKNIPSETEDTFVLKLLSAMCSRDSYVLGRVAGTLDLEFL